MNPQGPFSPFHQQRWIEVYNSGSATIPAYGCAEVIESNRPDTGSNETPSGGRTVLLVRQPTKDNAANFVICGPTPIAAGAWGIGTKESPAFVAYDTGNTPTSGDTWGPQSGSCLIKKGNAGLLIDGDANGTIVRVSRPGGSGAAVIRFRLTATMSNGGSATARILTFDGTNYNAGTTDIYVFDWYAVATGVSTRGMFQGVSGMEGYAAKRETPSVAGQEQYDIIWMEQYAWDCEVTLTANPTFSGTNYASAWSATATVDKSFHQGVSPGSSITVYDDQNMYPFAKSGAVAKVIRTEYEGSAPYYKIVVCQQLALTARATLSGSMCAASTATIAGFTVTSPSPFNLNLNPSTADNPRGHAGQHGDEVWLAFNKATPSYEIIDIDVHGISFIHALRMSGAYLQGAYRTIYAELCETTDNWSSLMPMQYFNWWCSGSYYQYCSGSLSSGSGSGSGSTGATCDCTTIPSTLYLTLHSPGHCWDGSVITLTKSGTTWSGSATLRGDSWSFSWACSSTGTNGLQGTLTVTYPACIQGGIPASPAASGVTSGATNSCDPVYVEFDGFTYTALSGCSTCPDGSTTGTVRFSLTA